MRFVIFSDIHLHEWQYGSRIVDGRNSRLEQQVNVLRQIANYCNVEGIDEAVVTGDVFHSSVVSASVSNAAYRGFRSFVEAGVHLTILPGNHDQSSRTGTIDALSWFSTLGTLVSGESVFPAVGRLGNKSRDGLSALYAAIPFVHDRSELARRLSTIDGDTRLLFLHQGVSGVELNSKGFTLNDALTPDMIPSCIALAATGHYHSAKRVTPSLVIPGSMTQLNWGDAGEFRGWLDVDYNPQTNEVHIIHLEAKAPKFVQIDRPDANMPISGNFIRLVTADATPTFAQDAIEHLMALGAESVEVKNIVQSENFVSNIQTSSFASLNEVIYAYAHDKHRSGDIDEFEVAVGEKLLKGNYQAPNA